VAGSTTEMRSLDAASTHSPPMNNRGARFRNFAAAAEGSGWGAICDGAIKAFTQDQHARIKELAKAHNVKVEKVKDLVGVYTHYRKPRKPNLWNAILHVKATEMNQGMPS